jgi:energy-coupling factor transporter ATP-binding protein EcfA2
LSRQASAAGVTLDVRRGTTACVIGPSGSGKSTLLRVVNRLPEPDAGDVLLDGESVLGVDPDALRRRPLGEDVRVVRSIDAGGERCRSSRRGPEPGHDDHPGRRLDTCQVLLTLHDDLKLQAMFPTEGTDAGDKLDLLRVIGRQDLQVRS